MQYPKFLPLTFGIVIFLFSGCINQPKKYSKELMYIYEYEDDELLEKYLYREKDYDSKGNLIKAIDYNEDGTVDETETYTYDEFNHEVLYSRIGYDHVEIRKIYDEKSNMVKKILIRNNILESIDSMVYEDTLKTEFWIGRFNTEEVNEININTWLIKGNQLQYKLFQTYEYNSEGKQIKTINWTKSKPDYIIEFKYDINGNCIEEITYSHEKKYSYNSNKMKEFQLSPDIKMTSQTLRTFDSNHNSIDEVGFSGGYVTFHFKYYFDENNYKIKTECLQQDQYIIQYEYSKNGRLIEETETKKSFLSGKNLKWVYKYKYL